MMSKCYTSVSHYNHRCGVRYTSVSHYNHIIVFVVLGFFVRTETCGLSTFCTYFGVCKC